MKIGRNEKCYCGSGKKYKRCCFMLVKNAFNAMKAKTTSELGEDDGSPLIQYFGYNTPRIEGENPFDLPEEGLCCMVSSVNKDIQREINTMVDYPLLKLGKGQWVITANDGDKMQFSGPFNSEDLAFETAKEKFGAIRFISLPSFI